MDRNILNGMTLEKAFQLAKKRVREKSYDEAVNIYSDILLKFPHNKKARECLKNLPYSDFYHKGNLHLKNGKIELAVSYYRNAITMNPDFAEAHCNLGVAYENLGETKNAIECFENTVRIKPNYLLAQMNLAVILMNTGNLDKAEVWLTKVLQINPSDPSAKVNMGNIHLARLELDSACDYYKQALKLNPTEINALYKLGITEGKKNNFRKSIDWYSKVLEMQPNHHDALNDAGTMFLEISDLSAAEERFRSAINFNPSFAEAHNNLGHVLTLKGKGGAINCFKNAIINKPDFKLAYLNLAGVLQTAAFVKYDAEFDKLLLNLIKQNTCFRPRAIANAIYSFIKLNPVFLNINSIKRFENLNQELNVALTTLSNIELFIEFINLCPVSDLEIEFLLSDIRRAVLLNIATIENTHNIFKLLSAISSQCFLNEYIFTVQNDELKALKELEAEVATRIENNIQPGVIQILVLSSYKALSAYQWADTLQVVPELKNIVTLQLHNRQKEQALSKSIPILNTVSDDTSSKVRDQYEHNPYPRWLQVASANIPLSVINYTKTFNLRLPETSVPNLLKPDILIAGCGTGMQAVEAAFQFHHREILAIDLSLASLSYAKRKTEELGIESVKYMQADILDLHKLDRQFDLIECAGVLHHMENPVAGWKILTECLKPGGMLMIGLYSELARQDILKVLGEISQRGINSNPLEMISFRNELIRSKEAHHRKLFLRNDFYTLSEFRDLLFHVQEHRFTIPQIQECLSELKLTFCGFHEPPILRRFKSEFREPDAAYDLSKWEAFEHQNPDVFTGMYQFWCQKTS